jgi:hypothetical protein
MYRFKKSLIALTGVLTLVAIVTVAVPHIGRGASGTGSNAPTSQTQNVNVVNTPSVNAQQSGTWNVGINGTPVVGLDAGNNTVKFDAVNNTVKVDPANPLSVRDVDNPARQPYGNFRIINLNDGDGGNTTFFSEVPAGKRLVIEQISLDGYVPTGQIWQRAVIGVDRGNSTLTFDIEVKPRGPDPFSNGARDQFASSQQVRLYADAGSTPSFFVQRSNSAGTARMQMTISGYFVDVP